MAIYLTSKSRVQEVRYNNGVKSEKYICWTRKQMRYMLGDHGYSYVVGNNPPSKPGQFPKRVHNRAASCPSPPANCSQVTALFNPQDNPHTIDGALVLVRHLCFPFICPAIVQHQMRHSNLVPTLPTCVRTDP